MTARTCATCRKPCITVAEDPDGLRCFGCLSDSWELTIERIHAGTVSEDRHVRWLSVLHFALFVMLAAGLIGLMHVDFPRNSSLTGTGPVASEVAAGSLLGGRR